MIPQRSAAASSQVRETAALTRGGAVVEYTLGGRRYAYKTSPRCKVCQSPSRMAIEEGILMGRTYSAILRTLPVDLTEGEDGFSLSSLKRHGDNHMPLDAIVSRAVIERSVADRGRSLDDPSGTLLDHHTLAREIVRQAGERMLRGELKVGLEHALPAMKLLFDEGARVEGSVDQAATETMLVSLFATLKQVLDAETLAAVGARLRHNPAWMEMIQKQLGMAADPIEVQARD